MNANQKRFDWPKLIDPWKKSSQSFRTAFLSACLLGVITHIYIFTNLLLNHDSVGTLYNDNDNLASGRWLLKFLSDFSTRFQMPVVIAVISIIMLALTAGFTVSILEISNKAIIVLTAGFLVAFPSVACIFSYMFTADAYFICLFFNALAVYLAKKYSWGFWPAIVLCASACGGYQAFICYAIGLFLMDCILELLNKSSIKQVVYKGIKYIFIVVGSLIVYYLILMIFLKLKGVTLTSYHGLDSISGFQVGKMIEQIPSAYLNFIRYFVKTPYNTRTFKIIQILFLLLSGCSLIYMVIADRLYCNLMRVFLLIVGIGLLPLALNFITLLSVGTGAHALMIYSFVLADVFALKLSENALKRLIENGASDWRITFSANILLAALLVWNNFCISNSAYLRMQVCYENSFALANRIVSRIEILDGYSPELPVAIVGEASRAYGGTVNEFSRLDALTGTYNQLIYSTDPSRRTRNFIEKYIGLHMPLPTYEQKGFLNDSEYIKELPSFPQEGSVVIYEGMIVVKLSDGTAR